MGNQSGGDDGSPSNQALIAGAAAVNAFRKLSDCKLAPHAYADVPDLIDISIPDNAVHDFRTSSMERWLKIASRQADSYIGQRFTVPLQQFSDSWVWLVCELAYFGMVGKRGHDPEAKTESTVDKRLDIAMTWLKSARDYDITPDPALVLTERRPVATMTSDVRRGWDFDSHRGGRGFAKFPRGFFRGGR